MDQEGLVQRKYLLSRLSEESADSYMFDYNDNKISVATYYSKEKKVTYAPLCSKGSAQLISPCQSHCYQVLGLQFAFVQ